MYTFFGTLCICSTLNHHTVHFKNLFICHYTSIKLERKIPHSYLSSFVIKCWGVLESFWKHHSSLSLAKHRKLWREEIYINSSLPCWYIPFSCPVLNKSFGFQMYTCETMFTNKYWKGSKSKCEHCTTR